MGRKTENNVVTGIESNKIRVREHLNKDWGHLLSVKDVSPDKI